MGFPPVPPEVKSIAHVLKVADEHEARNLVVTYWGRMYACQSAMKLIPGKKPPEVSNLLIAIMDWLESTKKSNHEVEGITNETVAQALIEEYAMQLFTFADGQDRAENFNKNMIKAFYTAGILMDILEQFGDLSDDLINKRKYAKWKAAYIHNCLKSGDTPTSGGPDEHLDNVTDLTQDKDERPSSIISPRMGNSGTPYDLPSTGPAPAPSPVTPNVSHDEPPFINPNPVATFPVQPIPPPVVTPSTPPATTPPSAGGYFMDPETIQKAQKLCKHATSALNYDDVSNAVENLTKALNLLKYGREN